MCKNKLKLMSLGCIIFSRRSEDNPIYSINYFFSLGYPLSGMLEAELRILYLSNDCRLSFYRYNIMVQVDEGNDIVVV